MLVSNFLYLFILGKAEQLERDNKKLKATKPFKNRSPVNNNKSNILVRNYRLLSK